jgi:hypothetical protein
VELAAEDVLGIQKRYIVMKYTVSGLIHEPYYFLFDKVYEFEVDEKDLIKFVLMEHAYKGGVYHEALTFGFEVADEDKLWECEEISEFCFESALMAISDDVGLDLIVSAYERVREYPP